MFSNRDVVKPRETLETRLDVVPLRPKIHILKKKSFLPNKIIAVLLPFFRFRKSLKSFVILTPLVGLTWVFGLLTVTDAGLVFQYIFTILNSTQVCIQ